MCKTFDKVVEDYFGIINGNSTLVFIKTGRGGSVYGYKNKYLKMACDIRDKYGYTVVVSANPVEYDCDLLAEIGYVKDEVLKPDCIYYMGISNGAVIGAQQGWKVPDIKRMLLINGPLMINLHKLIDGLRKYNGERICLVYGDKDPSYPYLGVFEKQSIENVVVKVAYGADHNFAGMESELQLLMYEELFGE